MLGFQSQSEFPSTAKLYIDHQKLLSIPPGCEKQPITGIFSLKIVTDYLNIMRDQTLFRCKMWGMEDSIVFMDLGAQKMINIHLRSSLENITKYFTDMQVLCIEVLQGLRRGVSSEKHTQRRKVDSDWKQVGWIIVNPQRYVINHVLNSFEEVVNVIDLRKQKIGEARVIFNLTMHKKDLYEHTSQPLLKESQSLPLAPSPQKRPQNKKQTQTQNQPVRRQQAYYPRFQQPLIAEKEQDHRRQYNFLPEFRKKGRAQQFLMQYTQSKPLHTDLSLLYQKYGFNLPSVQVLKLKYDEVKLLSNVAETETSKDQTKLNLLLKYLKLETKVKSETLTIICEEEGKKLKTQTKIVLGDQIEQTIPINYLYTLENKKTDIISFQIKDAKASLSIHNILASTQAVLKNKHGKIMATLSYSILSSTTVNNHRQSINRQKHQRNRPKIDNPKLPIPHKGQNISDEKEKLLNLKGRTNKQNGYVCIWGWPAQCISMKNSSFGQTTASKMLFQLNDTSSQIVQVILENRSRQTVYLQVGLTSLFKQQNYHIEGHQVKIISCRGNVNEILNLIQKLDPQKLERGLQSKPKTQEVNQNKDIVIFFQKLSSSQEVQCNELIQQLLTSEKLNLQLLDRLAKIIEVDSQIMIKVIQNSFSSNFSLFFIMFQVYHRWNHLYLLSQKKLKKAIEPCAIDIIRVLRRMKKNNQVLFGAVASGVFIQYFTKFDQQNPGGEYEQIGRLLVLLFERYFNGSIKIEQIETFMEERNNFLSLNSYMISKMCVEIVENRQEFISLLSQKENSFLEMFRNEKVYPSEMGLCRLLLDDHQVEESVLMQSIRRQTLREETFPTEESKEEKKQVKKNCEGEIEIGQLQQNKKKDSRIPIILTDISLLKECDNVTVNFESDGDNIRIENSELHLPKAVLLLQNQVYTIFLETLFGRLEGVFVANKEPRKINLYDQSASIMGHILLFDFRNSSEEPELHLQLVTHQQQFKQNLQFREKQIEQEEVAYNIVKATSSKVKITIRSVTPTRPNFKFAIHSHTQKPSLVDYPSCNYIIVENDENWKIDLMGEDYQQLYIPNQLGSHTFCLTHKIHKTVGYLLLIDISEQWGNVSFPNKIVSNSQAFIHVEELINLQGIKPGVYDLFLEQSQNVIQLGSIAASSKNNKLKIGKCFSRPVNQKIVLRMIDSQNKEDICEFCFMIKSNESPLFRCDRYLVSRDKGYRLLVTIFELNYDWQHCRKDRILSLFNNNEHKHTIQSFLQSQPLLQQERLYNFLKASFGLALGEIDLLFDQVIKKENDWKYFCSLFEGKKICWTQKREQVEQEFKIFDLEDEGMISVKQMKLVNRILQKNYQKTYQILSRNPQLFITRKEVDDQIIIDLAAPLTQKFDYLSFLSNLETHIEKENKPALSNQPNHIKIGSNSKYLSICLLAFQKLSLNGTPTTLLFKVNNTKLAEPVHRCYSHTYSSPSPVIVPNQKAISLSIYCQRLNMEGEWEYKLIQEVPLKEEVKVLGGLIMLKIEEKQSNQKPIFEREDVLKETPIKKTEIRKQLLRREEKKQIEMEKQENILDYSQFGRSFWNKSMNDTRMKWARTGEASNNKKRALQIRKQELQSKMNIFNQFYQ